MKKNKKITIQDLNELKHSIIRQIDTLETQLCDINSQIKIINAGKTIKRERITRLIV